MDYKYIEQLLERYWAAETTLEEEGILRTFFSQKDIPAEMMPYRDLFAYETTESENHHLGEDFDARILAMIQEEAPATVKAREISMRQRFMPLFKAAAVVAIILTIDEGKSYRRTKKFLRICFLELFPDCLTGSENVYFHLFFRDLENSGNILITLTFYVT